METIIIIIELIFCLLAALWLGAKLAVVLPLAGKLFDRKPFNCRPCLTFHLTWVLCTLAALYNGSVQAFVAGFVIAFAAFIAVWYMDRKRVDE